MKQDEESEVERESLVHGSTKWYGGDDSGNNGSTRRNRIPSLADPLDKERSGNRRPSRLEWAQASWTRCIHEFSWFWLNPIFRLGNKQVLTDDDLDDLPHRDKCSVLLNKLFIYDWSTSTWSIVLQAFGKDILYAGIIVLPYIGVRLAQPLFLRAIVQHINHRHNVTLHTQIGILLSIGLCLCCIVQAVLHHQVFFRGVRIGIRIRNALSAAIYRHLLSTPTSSLQQTTAAEIINLVANDVSKFEDFWAYAHFLWQTPLECVLTFCILSWILGIVPTLCGFAIVLPFIPVQLLMSRYFRRYRQATTICSDKRINAFSEILDGCQILKMYNWEKAMEERVYKMREEEVVKIKDMSQLRALNAGLFFVSPCLFAFMTFVGVWLTGSELRPADIFTAVACFGQLRLPLFNLMPFAIERLSLVLVASNRIDTFMKMKTVQPQKRQSRMTTNDKQQSELGTIVMHDASFSWGDDNVCLSSLSMNIKPGQFVGIVGPVGAGKSSLLAAILRELSLTNGDIQVNGSISYAPQSAWIFADTIRQNILLGKQLDAERYMRVLQACCLDVDLSAFGEVGDLLIIGEKGVNLSGGQRARVSLARALYADADIYLLDNPLAACDPKVAKRIFDACIGPQGLLHNKTRLLVTHQTHFLATSDQCIMLTSGRIDAQSSGDQLLNDQTNATQLDDDMQARKQPDQSESISANQLDLSKSVADIKSILRDERSVTGGVSWSVWGRLFTAPPLGGFGCFLLIFLLLIGEIFFDCTNVWLAVWSNQTYRVQQHSMFYVNTYTILTVGTLIAALLRAHYYFCIMLRGSSSLHNDMVKSVLYAPMSFFESNPSGRILNRASRDQQIVDEVLPRTLFDSVQSLFTVFGSVVIISMINPSIVVLVVIVGPISWYLYRYYLRTSRQLKRLENVTRSPVYALFSSSLHGLSTIRAFKVKDKFLQTFVERIDMNTRAYINMTGSTYWFGLRIDFIASLFVSFVAILAAIVRDQENPSYVALSLMSCLNMIARFQWGLLQLAESQNSITSAERLDEYARLPPEEDNGDGKRFVRPPPDWPNRGSIEFRNYTLRYRAELEPILHNIDLRIEPGEKVGIIGRTGAGKSTLFQAIFRLVERSAVDGEILIDDVDISRLTRNHLRSQLSVIPQLPILFTGTIRYNLDPFQAYTDEECFAALEAAQLKHRICDNPDGLSLHVAESGSNFSVGECQLICVARAVLRRSKILLIDEATANVDLATDTLIQNVITDKFRDRTVLTIAHRLNTVIQSDRILVMEGGRVSKFDVPDNVLHEQ